MSEQSRLSAFIAELRSRRVFRVAAFYGGIAFVIVQIIDGTFEVMGIPAWVSRLLITLLAVGFPVAIGLAWVFDITPEGIVRTEGRSSGKPGTSNRTLIAVTILAVVFGIWGRWGGGGRDFDPSSIRSIAVLALENQMGDASQDYFVSGMHEALITAISRLPGLRVISRTSVLVYKDKAVPMSQIAAELNVDALIEGSVFRDGDQVRITAQLIGMRPERHLWTEVYQRNIADVMNLHGDVARAIASEIELTLGDESAISGMGNRKIDPRAYDLYLRATATTPWVGSEQEQLEAISMLEQAVRVDPGFLEGWTSLSDRLSMFNFDAGFLAGEPDTPRLDKAGEALKMAQKLAPDALGTFLATGNYHYYAQRDYFKALQAFYAALALDPNNSVAVETIGYVQRRMGHTEESLQNLLLAHDSDPHNWDLTRSIGQSYQLLRNFPLAEKYFALAIAQEPHTPLERAQIALVVYYQSGQAHKALKWLSFPEGLSKNLEYEIALFLRTRLALETLADPDSSPEAIFKAWPESVWESMPEIDLRNYMIGIAYGYLQQPAAARDYYDLAAASITRLPDTEQQNWLNILAECHGMLGRHDQAVEGGQAWLDNLPYSNDAIFGSSREIHLARIYTWVGEWDQAIEILDRNLSRPSYITVEELALLPDWAPLRRLPQYRALMAKHGGQGQAGG